MVQVLIERGPRRPRRRAPTSSPASTRSSRRAAPFTPEAVAHGHRARRRRRSAASPASSPPRRAAVRLRAHRHHHRRVRHPHVVAGRRAQRAHRQPRPARRRHVHQGGRRRQQHPGQARATAGRCASHRRTQPRARAARDLRRAAGGRAWPRRSTRPGEGQIRALVTIAGNPVLSTPNSGRLDAALGEPRVHGVGRHLRQRDHPPRRRDPPGALRAPEGPLRPGPPAARAAQRRQLQRAGAARSTTDQPDEWEVLARLALVLQGAGADRRPGRWSTT